MLIIFYGNVVLHHVDKLQFYTLFSKDRGPVVMGPDCCDSRPAVVRSRCVCVCLIPTGGETGSTEQGLKVYP